MILLTAISFEKKFHVNMPTNMALQLIQILNPTFYQVVSNKGFKQSAIVLDVESKNEIESHSRMLSIKQRFDWLIVVQLNNDNDADKISTRLIEFINGINVSILDKDFSNMLVTGDRTLTAYHKSFNDESFLKGLTVVK